MGKDDFKIRLQPQDVANQKNPTHKNAAKIFIHPTTFAQGGFTTAHLCNVQTDGAVRLEAVAWPAPDKNVANNIISISRVFQKLASVELGQIARVTPGNGPVPDAAVVVMREITPDAVPLPSSEQTRWQYHLESRLEIAEFILPEISFDEIVLNGSRRSFVVTSVNGRTDCVAKYAPGTTIVEFSNEDAKSTGGKLEVNLLPAMRHQVNELNEFFDDFDVEFEGYTIPTYSCGIIIHGSHGTGKSMLLDQIAATNWGRVIRLTYNEKPSTIQSYFKTALEQRSPTIILIDDITKLIGKDQSNRQVMVETIGEALDALANKARQQNRRPHVLVVATCLDYLNDIPHTLQRPGRFEEHIALPVPDAQGRKEIIKHLKPTFSPDVFDQYISDLGDRTHAYTGADLRKVLYRATKAWRKRVGSPSKTHPLTWDDAVKGLQEVRPTAMHDINLKPPTVRWSDIGGYEEVKVALQRVLRHPTGSRARMSKPPKGVLLYGPPGCSKTMTAQAMATESDFNFFAVKGGELLNMYVGETERSIRNLFKRAREASPSIIFFDEFDSIAGSRSGPSGSGSSGGVQALTTLLTEMDGFERIGEVFVLAATNKPELLDSALRRPGRFDELIYVPLPDAKARQAIFTAKAKELEFPTDIDVAELASRTEGYSGAEVARICDKAFWDAEDETMPAMEVLIKAIEKTPRLVTGDMLEHYREWGERFRS
ncbi:AAA-domain-containing protein [Annulohypoxylon maeteangense]|uniref:AAA-domain-containing protein n=1 Tax=Annulohypoxylon maeteangense TaxID=1927788 RepID=UPI002007EA3B|nr:AAA-domain-containing protein [Annulohypoxylon maeteangense]KAI0890444.1 AAA-domain-containing protein [Annulohypoxylon maeteangense]